MCSLYFHGSRVRHLESAASDNDFFAISDGDDSISDDEQHYASQEFACDLTLISASQFENDLRSHNLWCLGIIFSPSVYVLKEAAFVKKLRRRFVLDSETLLHSAVFHCYLNFSKAAKKGAMGNNINEPKKRIFHSLLLITFAIDASINSGRVTDQLAANKYWRELQTIDMRETSYAMLHERWYPVLRNLFETLFALHHRPFGWNREWHLCKPFTTSYTRATSVSKEVLESLRRSLLRCELLSKTQQQPVRSREAEAEKEVLVSIYPITHWVHHREYPNVVLLSTDKEEDDCIIKNSGVVLHHNKRHNEWELVCLSRLHKRDRISIESSPSFILFFRLYHFDGNWKLCSMDRPDSASFVDRFASVGDNDRDHPHQVSHLVWSTWIEMGLKPPMDKSLCYTFVLSSKSHHDRDRRYHIQLHSCINMKTLDDEENLFDVASSRGWNLFNRHRSVDASTKPA